MASILHGVQRALSVASNASGDPVEVDPSLIGVAWNYTNSSSGIGTYDAAGGSGADIQHRIDLRGFSVRRLRIYPVGQAINVLIDEEQAANAEVILGAAATPLDSLSTVTTVIYCPAGAWTEVPGEGGNYTHDLSYLDMAKAGATAATSVRVEGNY